MTNDECFGAENAQKDLFLTFHIGREDFGIDISDVIEIIGVQKITEVPDMPNYIRG
ncbi:MAG: chemotaxis protein CheW, partial [Deltaproteobacteria bacterium]|nr:chemotaxis protein CheW [Deltaproteobacteria bacterium]